MAESFKSKRVIFKKGAQGSFLLKAKNKLNLDWIAISKMLGISPRTLIDWHKEKFSMSLSALKILCEKTNIAIPKNIEIKDPFWYASKGARKGGLAKFKKYGCVGDSETRKKKWQEWWEKEGKNKKSILYKRIPINKPRKSVQLAEFTGIVLGDGGISKRQVTVTLHRITDKKYSYFVRGLIKKLFNVIHGKYCDQKGLADNIVVSRSDLVDFCKDNLGLKIGNKIKQQVDIPNWIKENKKFQIACVRGLVDTDGSVWDHKYNSNGKMYSYKKLGFTSLSKPLLYSVFSILKDNGLNPRMYKEKEIRLDSIESMRKYFMIFGSNNPKHLNKYRK